jgi:tetratricopeptide (TPR) repeat protein
MSWKDEDSTPTLIHPLDAAFTPQSHSDTDAYLEPAFLTRYQGKLHLDARGWIDQAKAHYAHAIARNPGNLLVHVQRISLYAETADPAILGALLDLFLVLGERGIPLRRRMLALARPILSSQDHHALHQQLEQGHPIPSSLHAHASSTVLSRGITGTTHLISKREQAPSDSEDPLETARQQIDIGQIELAQQTLESALLADSSRLSLHLALLEIYRHARDRQRTIQLWQQLQGRENPAEIEWRRLLKQLEAQESTDL